MNHNIKVLILAGGSGTRLWPLSRKYTPKQFLGLDGGASLLEKTIQRLVPLIQKNDIWIMTNEKLAKGMAYHSLLEYNKILEPAAKNTMAAIAYSAAIFSYFYNDPTMVVLPSDHYIKDQIGFQEKLSKAIQGAEENVLITFGIEPEFPATGFGYIEADKIASQGTKIKKLSSLECHPVKSFIEKPDLATAQSFLQQGNYFWNSGMFVWKSSAILTEIEKYIPESQVLLEKIRAQWDSGQSWENTIKKDFIQFPSISIDFGVLEKSKNVFVIPAKIGWSDVGSWDAVYDISEKETNGNVLKGKVIPIETRDCLIQSHSKIVATVGIEKLHIIETPDAVLVMKRGESQKVKEVVEILKENNAQELDYHLTVERPWGSYTILGENENKYKIKKIEVYPGQVLSLQSHQHRSEHWVVVSGTAYVTKGEEEIIVKKNEGIYIPVGAKHKLENKGKIPLQIIEVQVGEYLGEDDIIRFDDIYGR